MRGEQWRVVTALSAGRYLAKDWGATFADSRAFDNGVTMGAYATKIDVSSKDYGEGGFDKGICVSVPFDFPLPRSTRARANFIWNPLYRDGGARVDHAYSLYQATSERDPEFFFDNLEQVTHSAQQRDFVWMTQPGPANLPALRRPSASPIRWLLLTMAKRQPYRHCSSSSLSRRFRPSRSLSLIMPRLPGAMKPSKPLVS